MGNLFLIIVVDFGSSNKSILLKTKNFSLGGGGEMKIKNCASNF
jgi:hypothetical protein